MPQVSTGLVELRSADFILMPYFAAGRQEPVFDFVRHVLLVGPVPGSSQALSIVGVDGLKELFLGRPNIARGPAPRIAHISMDGKVLCQPGLGCPVPRPNPGWLKRLCQAGYVSAI